MAHRLRSSHRFNHQNSPQTTPMTARTTITMTSPSVDTPWRLIAVSSTTLARRPSPRCKPRQYRARQRSGSRGHAGGQAERRPEGFSGVHALLEGGVTQDNRPASAWDHALLPPRLGCQSTSAGGCGAARACPSCAILSAWSLWSGHALPAPNDERRSLKQELAEIPGQIAAYRQELENGRPPKARRERLEWQIREREKRLGDVEARLAAMKVEQ